MHFPEIWTRCFYTMSKCLMNQNMSRLRYLLTCLIFIYSHRLLFISYAQYRQLKPGWISAFLAFDPTLRYFTITMAHVYDWFIPIMLYLFALFTFVCQHKFYWLDVRTQTWTFWNQMVVQMQDRYHECVLSSDRVAQILKRKQNKIKRHLDTYKLAAICPAICKRAYCKVRAKAEMLYHLDHVDKRKLFAHSFSLLPSVSSRIQLSVLLALLLLDKSAFIAQLILGIDDSIANFKGLV